MSEKKIPDPVPPWQPSAKELVARLRAVDHMSVEDCFLQSPLFAHAADCIERLNGALVAANERTAAPAHVLNEDDAADLQEGRPYQDVLAAKRTAPPTDGPEFETTAEERANWRYGLGDDADVHAEVLRLLRDLDKAIAFAASETKRADEARSELARLASMKEAGDIAVEEEANKRIKSALADRDREAAARREAEAERATLRAALLAIRGLVKEGEVPRYTVTPGAALNSVIEEIVDPVLARTKGA